MYYGNNKREMASENLAAFPFGRLRRIVVLCLVFVIGFVRLGRNRSNISESLMHTSFTKASGGPFISASMNSSESNVAKKNEGNFLTVSPPITKWKKIFNGWENIDDMVQAFRSKGGVIVFLHNPKTGGSTVREFIESQVYESRQGAKVVMSPQNTRHVSYWGTHTKESWELAKSKIDDILSDPFPNGTIFVMEDHVMPNIPDTLVPSLKEWRKKSRANNIPIFVVTQVREPISHYVSRFNYFEVIGKKVEPTEDKLLDKIKQENLQCSFFLSGQFLDNRMSRDRLQSVLEQVDWVHDTNRFGKEMLPLLAYMTRLQLRDLGVVQPMGYKEKTKKLKISDLSNETLAILGERSAADMELYQNLTMYYRDFSRWKTYLKSKGALTECQWIKTNQTCVYPGGEVVSSGNLPAYLQK